MALRIVKPQFGAHKVLRWKRWQVLLGWNVLGDGAAGNRRVGMVPKCESAGLVVHMCVQDALEASKAFPQTHPLFTLLKTSEEKLDILAFSL